MMGGLGNQMFQYALYKAFEQKHIDVYADLAWYKNKSVKFELYNFGIKIIKPIITEAIALTSTAPAAVSFAVLASG